MEILKTLLTSLVVPLLVGGGATWWTHRWRERVTWQESAKGQLAKMRAQAVAEALAALGQLYELTARGSGMELEEVERAAESVRESLARQLFLLPPRMRRAIDTALHEWPYSGRQAAREAAERLSEAIEPFLPEMMTRD